MHYICQLKRTNDSNIKYVIVVVVLRPFQQFKLYKCQIRVRTPNHPVVKRTPSPLGRRAAGWSTLNMGRLYVVTYWHNTLEHSLTSKDCWQWIFCNETIAPLSTSPTYISPGWPWHRGRCLFIRTAYPAEFPFDRSDKWSVGDQVKVANVAGQSHRLTDKFIFGRHGYK